MNWGIETIGIMAGVLLYGAMAFKTLVIIKALLLAGACLFLTYSIIYALPAMIIVNSIGIVIGIYGLIMSIRNHKEEYWSPTGCQTWVHMKGDKEWHQCDGQPVIAEDSHLLCEKHKHNATERA